MERGREDVTYPLRVRRGGALGDIDGEGGQNRRSRLGGGTLPYAIQFGGDARLTVDHCSILSFLHDAPGVADDLVARAGEEL
jgi:hypothetical protein